jgi:hypothetical protein
MAWIAPGCSPVGVSVPGGAPGAVRATRAARHTLQLPRCGAPPEDEEEGQQLSSPPWAKSSQEWPAILDISANGARGRSPTRSRRAGFLASRGGRAAWGVLMHPKVSHGGRAKSTTA